MSLSSPYRSTDIFSWKGITLYQDESVLKAGTDALLLATWIPTLRIDPKKILDVGTGSGILALLMAHAFQQSSILAIDPDEHAVQLALFNVGASNFKNRIHVDQTGVLEYAASTDQHFDLILSNPPFYVDHILPTSGSMRSAKHATSSPKVWMAACAKLLNDQGCICLVLPTLVTFEWTKEANANQLYCTNRMDFFSFPGDKQAKRSLLCFSSILDKPLLRTMIMYQREKKYTAAYASWIGI